MNSHLKFLLFCGFILSSALGGPTDTKGTNSEGTELDSVLGAKSNNGTGPNEKSKEPLPSAGKGSKTLENVPSPNLLTPNNTNTTNENSKEPLPSAGKGSKTLENVPSPNLLTPNNTNTTNENSKEPLPSAGKGSKTLENVPSPNLLTPNNTNTTNENSKEPLPSAGKGSKTLENVPSPNLLTPNNTNTTNGESKEPLPSAGKGSKTLENDLSAKASNMTTPSGDTASNMTTPSDTEANNTTPSDTPDNGSSTVASDVDDSTENPLTSSTTASTNESVSTSSTGDVSTSSTVDDSSVLKLMKVAIKKAGQIKHCQFTFGPLTLKNPEDIVLPQVRWEATRDQAGEDLVPAGEVPVDYRISTPAAANIQGDFNAYYLDNTTTLAKNIFLSLPDHLLPANDPSTSDDDLIALFKTIFHRSEFANRDLLNGTEQAERSLPFLKRELRLMNHRFCLFRLMADLRDAAEQPLEFMPGFIGYNAGVAKSMLALYTDLKNDELIDAIINGEHALDQVKTVSSSALHGNLLGSDGKAALYFIVHAWDKSLPECEDNLQPAHVMVKKGNDMERALPICRPKWLTRVSDILAATTTENTAETTPSTAQTEPPSPDHTEESPDHTEESPDHTEESPDHTEESPEQTEETPPSDEPEE
ncbi:hypothetical protein GPALN_010433 [Globodera pallida]|nr:hypothetical protein GPALN_010433 [Globodera pallida]